MDSKNRQRLDIFTVLSLLQTKIVQLFDMIIAILSFNEIENSIQQAIHVQVASEHPKTLQFTTN